MKRRNTIAAKVNAPEPTTVRILKRTSCPSLSGKSSLVYEVGLDEGSKAVQLRIVANTGGGTWSNGWQTLEAIGKALERVPKDRPVTANTFAPLFSGSSQNSPYFLAAALKHVGMIVPSEDKRRCYARAEPKAFMDEVKDLLSGKLTTEAKKGQRGKAPSYSHSDVAVERVVESRRTASVF